MITTLGVCSEGSAWNLWAKAVEHASANGNLKPPACIELKRSTIDRDSRALVNILKSQLYSPLT